MKKFIFVTLMVSSFFTYANEWTKGEIRRVDIDNKKLTIKHEEIKSLDMPPMSMVFNVESVDSLKGLKPGDQVEFIADQKGTKLFANQIKQLQ